MTDVANMSDLIDASVAQPMFRASCSASSAVMALVLPQPEFLV